MIPLVAQQLAIFTAASLVVWFAGTRLSLCAKAIHERLQTGQAFLGIILGGISSLPEMMMSFTAAAHGNGTLALTTLLGGIQVTMVAIAIIDALVGGPPLTRDVTRPVILLQGVLVICHLSLVQAGIALEDPPIAGRLGIWSALLTVGYVLMVRLIRIQETRRPWVVSEVPFAVSSVKSVAPTEERMEPIATLLFRMFLAGTATAGAGYFLALSGDGLARTTGIGSGFIGLVLGGIATTLPELVTIYSAVKLNQYEMAFADAFGTNMFSIMLITFADWIYPGAPLLGEAGRFSAFAVVLGIATTGIYLIGLIDRGKRTLLSLGYDSIMAIGAYIGGLIVLYNIRH